MSDTILFERDGPIAIITLNRPEKLNALTRPMWQRLGEVARGVGSMDDVRCVVLRGAGDEAFAPGNDISEFPTERSNTEQARRYGAIMHSTIEALWALPQPVVAMIKGVCVGGGLEIASLADIRICGASSRFGAPINRLGLVMAYAEIKCLIDLVGESNALEILFEGRIFTASEARHKGIVNRVVPDAQVEAETMATAQRIVEGAPLVARWHKKFVRRLRQGTPLSQAEIDEGFACFGTEDFQIGYKAFLAKEKPKFIGK
ncbi:MAG: enoyl-CoA hydratase-related protein [Betaproteobacteria bacterium]